MKKIACLLLAAVTLWLFFVVFAYGVAIMTWPSSSLGNSWVSREELHMLARYHGTEALKITEIDVSIWRAGEWIPVLKNKI